MLFLILGVVVWEEHKLIPFLFIHKYDFENSPINTIYIYIYISGYSFKNTILEAKLKLQY